MTKNTKDEKTTWERETWFDQIWNPIGDFPAAACCAVFTAHVRIHRLRTMPAQRLLLGRHDLFASEVPDAAIRDIYRVMAYHQRHTFLVLTENAYRMEQWFGSLECTDLQEDLASRDRDFPPANVHLGVMVSDQDGLTDRIGALVASPAAHRFVVAHRLREDIDLTCVQCPMGEYERTQVRTCTICMGSEQVCTNGEYNALAEGIDRVVMLRHKPKTDREQLQVFQQWQRLAEQCRLHSVPVFYT